MLKILSYIREYIDEDASCADYNKEARRLFSLQLAGTFEYYIFHVFNERFLVIRPVESIAVSKLQGMVQIVEDKTGMCVATAFNELNPYAIKKMLKERMAFIVPGKQISLPFLALCIKNERKRIRKEIKKFSPGTQLVFLYLLYSDNTDFDIDQVINNLSVSKMTAVRGLNDLYELGLLTFDTAGQTGRKKIYHKSDSSNFYSEGRKYLDNPVRETVYIKELPKDLVSVKTDLTALAELTMMAEPAQKRLALCSKNRSQLDGAIIDKAEALEDNLPMIQLTKYDTGILGKRGCADPISIMLGLEEKDDRIEMAINDLLKKYEWYIGEEQW
ncbi:hypothetical protein SAMN06296386_109119 [Lachnospiraceae bacterium]|nr:hypothetical protein SAMN06296386_109119 [Lachnospiraceae bacterium]